MRAFPILTKHATSPFCRYKCYLKLDICFCCASNLVKIECRKCTLPKHVPLVYMPIHSLDWSFLPYYAWNKTDIHSCTSFYTRSFDPLPTPLWVHGMHCEHHQKHVLEYKCCKIFILVCTRSIKRMITEQYTLKCGVQDLRNRLWQVCA